MAALLTDSAADRRRVWVAATVLTVAVLAAYAGGLGSPMVFDDVPTLVDNLTIRHVGLAALSPPHGYGGTTEGRPLLNLSFALNYAWSGPNPIGYRATNVVIHLLAGLVLFGVVRRTLLGRRPARALAVGWSVALLWTLHPLQTESVTYIVQRAESLVGLFYLLTLYGVIRSATSAHAARWQLVAVAACTLGMMTKEVMVSAPLVVLLYDRAFLAGSLRAAWRARRGCYLGLAATWLVLAALVAGMQGIRGGSAGFGLGTSACAYGLKQCEAIVHYTRLGAWPDALVFDYGTDVIGRVRDVLPQLMVLAAFAGGIVVALRRNHALGFLGFAFLAVLAPSSSVVPVITQTMAEHRMYLPLAALIAAAVLGFERCIGRYTVAVAGVLAVALALLTVRRNQDYRSDFALWSDTLAKRPNNARAHYNVASGLVKQDREADAEREFQAALQLKPNYAEAYYNLGNARMRRGDVDAAIDYFGAALRYRPDYAKAHYNLATALHSRGRFAEAAIHYAAAVRLEPDDAEAHNNFGAVLLQLDRRGEAVREWESALRLTPDSPKTHYNLGIALQEGGELAAALAHFERAAQGPGATAKAHFALAVALEQANRPGEAAAHYEQALQLQPDFPAARENLRRLRASGRD
jgi:tetratricopeptide (TPR) repeat protein